MPETREKGYYWIGNDYESLMLAWWNYTWYDGYNIITGYPKVVIGPIKKPTLEEFNEAKRKGTHFS